MNDEEIMREALMQIACDVAADVIQRGGDAQFWRAMFDDQRGIAQDALDAIAKRS